MTETSKLASADPSVTMGIPVLPQEIQQVKSRFIIATNQMDKNGLDSPEAFGGAQGSAESGAGVPISERPAVLHEQRICEACAAGGGLGPHHGPDADGDAVYHRDIKSHSTPSPRPVVVLEKNKVEEVATSKLLQVEGKRSSDFKAQGFAVEEIPWEPISTEEEKLLAEARAAISPKTLHQGLRQRVLEAGIEAARAAISAVRKQVARGGVVNPAGLLVTALRQGWEPAERPYTGDEVSEELREWYPRAVAAGFVEDVPLRYLPTIMGERQVRVPRLGQTPPYELVAWREMRARLEQKLSTGDDCAR